MSDDADATEDIGDDEGEADPPETDGTAGSSRPEAGGGSGGNGSDSDGSSDGGSAVEDAAGDSPAAGDSTDGVATDDGATEGEADEAAGGVSPARDMTVNVGIVTALVLTPLVWALLEGVLTLFGHHPGTWQLRLITVGVMNLAFWTALGIDESREDDWVGLAAVGWLLVLLPLWLAVEVAVLALDLSALAGLEQTGLRLGISGLSALLFGILLDRRRD